MRCNLPKIVLLLLAILYVVACSETPKTTEVQASQASSQPAGPSGPVSGKTAFWAMYKSAYAWSNDVAPLKLESKALPGIKNDAGSAAMWTATFGSQRKQQAIEITYAIAALPPDIVQGVNVGHPFVWGGATNEVMPFAGSDIVIDSDAAYKAAAVQAQSWIKAHPGKDASFLLGNNSTTFATPVWYVKWGDKKSGYNAFVNTKNGEIAKAVK